MISPSVVVSIAAVIGNLIFPLFGFILSSYDLLFIVIILARQLDHSSQG